MPQQASSRWLHRAAPDLERLPFLSPEMPSTAPTAAEELSCTAGPHAWEKMAAEDSTTSFSTERSALTHAGVCMHSTPESLVMVMTMLCLC